MTRDTTSILKLLFVWFLVSVLIGANGVLGAFPFPFPQIIIFFLTFCVLVVCLKIEWIRQWVFSSPPEALVAVHIIRFIGFYFLTLYDEQRLPYEFAVIGGWGDIIVASFALLIVIHRLVYGGFTRVWILAWNIVGLIDILYVVSTAARLGMNDPDSMVELTQLPLALLPLIFVPLIISTHVLLFFVLFNQGTPRLVEK